MWACQAFSTHDFFGLALQEFQPNADPDAERQSTAQLRLLRPVNRPFVKDTCQLMRPIEYPFVALATFKGEIDVGC